MRKGGFYFYSGKNQLREFFFETRNDIFQKLGLKTVENIGPFNQKRMRELLNNPTLPTMDHTI